MMFNHATMIECDVPSRFRRDMDYAFAEGIPVVYVADGHTEIFLPGIAEFVPNKAKEMKFLGAVSIVAFLLFVWVMLEDQRIYVTALAIILFFGYMAKFSFSQEAIDSYTARNVIEIPYELASLWDRDSMNNEFSGREEDLTRCWAITKRLDLSMFAVLGEPNFTKDPDDDDALPVLQPGARIKYVNFIEGEIIPISTMIYTALNASLATGRWDGTDKILGAVTELKHQKERYNVDEELVSYLEKSIMETYLEVMFDAERLITSKEEIEAIDPKSQKEYWEFIFGNSEFPGEITGETK